jgi:hypothetical protein
MDEIDNIEKIKYLNQNQREDYKRNRKYAINKHEYDTANIPCRKYKSKNNPYSYIKDSSRYLIDKIF